jgi:hypothetical protein
MNPDKLDLCIGLQAYDIPECARLLEVVMSPSYQVSDFDFYKRKELSLIYIVSRESSSFKSSSRKIEVRKKIISI